MGNIRDPLAAEPLFDAIRDKNANVRESAARALKRMGSSVIEKLIFALKEDDLHIRSTAASILGELKDSRAVVPLVEALRDPMWLVRFEAAASLGKIKDPRAIEPLRDALNDKDSTVRAAAEEALNAIEER